MKMIDPNVNCFNCGERMTRRYITMPDGKTYCMPCHWSLFVNKEKGKVIKGRVRR